MRAALQHLRRVAASCRLHGAATCKVLLSGCVRASRSETLTWMPNSFPDSYLMARVPAGPRLAAVLCSVTAVL